MASTGQSQAAKVIVGYDGRARSDDALVLGRVLAEALGGDLLVAAAIGYEPAGNEVSDHNEARSAFFDGAFDRARTVLAGADFEPVELEDTPAHGLHRLAESAGAAVLVVGSSHRGPVGRVFPGSVAERVLRGAPCPVAVAPAGYAEKNGWIETITVGVDGRDLSRPALDFAVGIARGAHARLTLLRVGPDAYWGTVAVPPLEEIEAANRRSLRAALGRVPDDVDADSEYCIGDPAEELVRHGAAHDLLVLGSRGYGPIRGVLLGGVSSFVVRNSATPVVVVPRGAERADGAREAAAGTAVVT